MVHIISVHAADGGWSVCSNTTDNEHLSEARELLANLKK